MLLHGINLSIAKKYTYRVLITVSVNFDSANITIIMRLSCRYQCTIIAKYAKYNLHGPLGRNYVQVYLNEGIEMENENARRKIRTKLFNNLVDDGDDDVNMSATVHQIVELCAWRGERVYRPHDHNNFNEEEIDALIEYLCTN